LRTRLHFASTIYVLRQMAHRTTESVVVPAPTSITASALFPEKIAAPGHFGVPAPEGESVAIAEGGDWPSPAAAQPESVGHSSC